MSQVWPTAGLGWVSGCMGVPVEKHAPPGSLTQWYELRVPWAK